MIAWALLIAAVLLLLTLPARVFGWICGAIARIMVRDRKPPLPPPI